MIYENCYDAIRDANAAGMTAVGWLQGHGWLLYDPRKGPPENVRPEFWCVRSGLLPIPLSEEGRQIFKEMLTSQK